MEPDCSMKCPECKQLIHELQFMAHIKKCDNFSGLALKHVKRIPDHLSSMELKMIVAELKVCVEIVENRLANQRVMRESLRESKNAEGLSYCEKCKRKLVMIEFDSNSIFCVDECWHMFCISCIRKQINEDYVNSFGNLLCMASECKSPLQQYQIEGLLGKQQFEQIQRKAIRKMMNLVQCVKCHSEYEFMPGNPKDAPKKDENGKLLTEKDQEIYALNRFVCPKGDCKTEQCKECRIAPFHTGLNCEDSKKKAIMKKCRYCLEPLNLLNFFEEALADICNSKQCSSLAERACTKILGCGHSCLGFRGEVKCLPCLNENCCKNNEELNGESEDDYCNICFVEALSASPCVRSTCGHIFHEKCVRKRYQIRWLTPRILFNFCLCPLCKSWITLPEQNPLSKQINTCKNLFSKIQTMSRDRLKFEDCEKDEKLTNKSSPYFQKPTEYAMAIYAYFQCFKCKNPYFGGRKNCAQAMNEANQGSFKPEQLICPNCCEIPIENCSKHGTDFIEFKCQFCCSIAQWFCWGTTHFCEPCHKRQVDGDYVSKYSKSQLPKCLGPKLCPAGGNHGENGSEMTLGCAICRSYKVNNKNF